MSGNAVAVGLASSGRLCAVMSVMEKDGAGDRDRTGDIQLGKLAFYR